VDEHTDVVDERDRRMDLVVGPAEEAKREGSDRVLVTGLDDRHLDGGGFGDGGRAEDGDARELARDAFEVFRGPVVRVLVRDNDTDDRLELAEVGGEAAGVDDEALAPVLNGEMGMFVLDDAHETTLPLTFAAGGSPGAKNGIASDQAN